MKQNTQEKTIPWEKATWKKKAQHLAKVSLSKGDKYKLKQNLMVFNKPLVFL